MEELKIERSKTKCISGNYFSENCKQEALKAIEQGYWVYFSADCIGHTRAEMFERDGREFLIEKYGEENLQIAVEDGWKQLYIRRR